MSEVPSGSWDSPQVENFASHVGRERRASGESSADGGGGGGGRDDADPDPAEVHDWYTTGMELLGKGSPAAAANFRAIVEASPADDYANFGLGLALARGGDHEAAAEYLALAAAMRPDRKPYTDALHQVRATLKYRKQPPSGH